MSFYEQFMRFKPEERQRIAEKAGISLGYITKHMYVSEGAPKFTFANAVALDKASRGALPFTEHTEGGVDWKHVRRTLNRMHREGLL